MGVACRGPVPQRRVRAALPLAVLLLALPLCAAVAASPAADEACSAGGARIVAKDALGGVQAVSLRRFDEGAGAWEVESVGGVVTTVPAGSLVLDLGSPPPQLRPGAADAAYRVGTSEMLDASGHEANTILGVYATRRIEAGAVILDELPVVRGARGIAFGQGSRQAKTLLERFLALPQARMEEAMALCRPAARPPPPATRTPDASVEAVMALCRTPLTTGEHATEASDEDVAASREEVMALCRKPLTTRGHAVAVDDDDVALWLARDGAQVLTPEPSNPKPEI
ncbi:hypothetical protein T484DRAFT_1888494 [Baffinella frigidus]|nr:hypothetical protein T484DRAFT_1888494 [Cryptophyta sp. CCMP2293]